MGKLSLNDCEQVFRLPCEVEDVVEHYSIKRQQAKAVTFGIMYGAGPAKISEQVTKDSGKYFSPAEAKGVIDDYFTAFPKLKVHASHQIHRSLFKQMDLYTVISAEREDYANVFSQDKGIASHEVRSGVNALVQSVASDVNLLGAIEMQKYIVQTGMKAKIFALFMTPYLQKFPKMK